MDVETMRLVGQDILALPARFNMSRWFEQVPDKGVAEEIGHSTEHLPPCGTVCCFAGEWAVREGRVKLSTAATRIRYHPEDACKTALGLPNERLFHVEEWPESLQEDLSDLDVRPGTPEYAAYFVNVVLENYIATNGWEDDDAEE